MTTLFFIIIIALCLIIAYLLMKRDKIYFYGERLKNFPVKIKGKEYWISRSCAVVGIVGKYDKETGDVYVLANKRGPGCPDFIGYWNIPCGYVDYDETLEEAISREIFEETGLSIPTDAWSLYGINSDPKDSEKQSISIRFIADYDESMGVFDYTHQEKNEVDDIMWINLKDIDDYDWAFNQINLLNELKEKLSKN